MLHVLDSFEVLQGLCDKQDPDMCPGDQQEKHIPLRLMKSNFMGFPSLLKVLQLVKL